MYCKIQCQKKNISFYAFLLLFLFVLFVQNPNNKLTLLATFYRQEK